MIFSDLYNFLTGWIKVMPVTLAEQIVNQSLETIYNEYEWSFLFDEDYLITPARIFTGTVNVTKFSNQVLVSSDLKAILDAITVNDVPLVGRQFRTLSNDTLIGSIIYTIADYDSANSLLTLDKIYLGPTNSTSQFEIFKIYYNPPDSLRYVYNGKDYYDFAYIKFLIDLTQNRKIYINQTQSIINSYDMNRTYRGNPFTFVPYKQDSNGFPIFEFYPIPEQERVYKFIYKKKGRPLSDEDYIPSQLSYELCTAKIKSIGYEWIETNKSTFPELKVVNALSLNALILNANNPNGYPQLLQQAKRMDEELFPKAWLEDYGDLPYLDIEGGNPMWLQPPRETLLLNY